MVFACQKDSFLKEFNTKVVSCESASIQLGENKKSDPITSGFEVICEDTVLFPEGGGQPSDRGLLNDVPVLQVTRRGAQAVHFVTSEIPIGTQVLQKVDWERRLDHMQQHSGQHLVTALADLELGFKTTSWWLGEQVSYIELDTPSITEQQVALLEKLTNDKIRSSLPVNMTIYEPGDPALKEAKTRGLPEDHVGSVRVISISGLDNNMCCGTHVSNLSQLQAIKLLYAEKGKKNKTNLFFLSGNRVLSQLGICVERERQLTTLLKNNPTDHVDLVDKLQKSLKIALKNNQNALKDIAALEAEKFKQLTPRPAYVCLHRKDGDSDFARVYIREIGDDAVLKFLTWGKDKGEGQMQMQGPSEIVATLGPKVCEILKGKGAAKGANFLAKVTALNQRSKAETLIQEHFNSL